MVKNTKGGKGHKSLGRKFQNQSSNGYLRTTENKLEKYGIVTKLFGHGMCEVFVINNEKNELEELKLVGHIRNKMRGRQKRNNMVTMYSIVLIGLREFETIYKNCDILTIYDDNQVKLLKQDESIKSELNFLEKLNPSMRGPVHNEELGFVISAYGEEDANENIDLSSSVATTEVFISDDNETINIDDI